MAIFQVQFVPEKKRVQITSRIFIDDLNKALEKNYHVKATIGNGPETPEEIAILKKYFGENLVIRINNQSYPLHYKSSEMEEDVLVSYFLITEVSKIQQLNIKNTLLIDWNSDQQNIMHFTVNETKKSLIFTESSKNQMLKYH
jgi:hypothetical protein